MPVKQKALKPAKTVQPYSAYVQKQKRLAPTTAKPLNKKKKKRAAAPIASSQGVLMNNFFPALEGGLEEGGYSG